MKKKLILLLALALVLGAMFTGCSKEEAAEAPASEGTEAAEKESSHPLWILRVPARRPVPSVCYASHDHGTEQDAVRQWLLPI